MPPQNGEYRCCYCVFSLARAFLLMFTRDALLWRAGTVLVMLRERRGVVRFAFAGVAAASNRAARATRAVRAARAAVQLVALRGYTLLLPLVALQAQQLAVHFDVRLPSILPVNGHLLVVAFFPFALEDR